MAPITTWTGRHGTYGVPECFRDAAMARDKPFPNGPGQRTRGKVDELFQLWLDGQEQAAKAMKDAKGDALDSQDFYEICQVYRTTEPGWGTPYKEFEALKAWIRANCQKIAWTE